MKHQYNIKDKYSIEAYAKRLLDKSLSDVLSPEDINAIRAELNNKSNKGKFGSIIEKYFFGIEPGNKSAPDFEEAGVELKTSPLKENYRSKERLVLGMIDYCSIVNETWKGSHFLKKNLWLLLMFYMHDDNKILLELIIKIIGLWSYSEEDFLIIKRDWELIQQKIIDGKAHELSEGDTLYLGACTKASTSADRRKQPNSNIPAKPRAFALKQTYVNIIIEKMREEMADFHHTQIKYGRIIKNVKELKNKNGLEEITLSKLKPYIGLSDEQIQRRLRVKFKKKPKNVYSILTYRMLGVEKPCVEEFEKANIELKTIRLKNNNLPKEDMSFPAFKYTEIVKEDWDNCELKTEYLEKKFLFVVFKYNDKQKLIFQGAFFWNMPYRDMLEVQKVWKETQKRIKYGNCMSLPKKSENKICHVRPHATNKNDTYPTPNGGKAVKKCFWLNTQYIRDQVLANNMLIKP